MCVRQILIPCRGTREMGLPSESTEITEEFFFQLKVIPSDLDLIVTLCHCERVQTVLKLKISCVNIRGVIRMKMWRTTESMAATLLVGGDSQYLLENQPVPVERTQ